MKKSGASAKFLPVMEIDWIDKFVEKPIGPVNVFSSLKTISRLYNLPIKATRVLTPKKKGVSKLVSTFSPKAIQILKEKMEQNPENFDNGRMLKWE